MDKHKYILHHHSLYKGGYPYVIREVNNMIEYLIIKAKNASELQEDLDEASADGWIVVCSCGREGDKIILKRKRFYWLITWN